MATDGTRSARRCTIPALVFLASAASLVLEVSFVRLFSAMFRYHFAFLALSTAMLGISLSGVYLRQRRTSTLSLKDSLLLFCATSLVIVFVAVRWGRVLFDQWSLLSFGRMGILFLLLVIPFFFGGLCILLPLRSESRRSGTIYGMSLLGAGAGGCLAPFLSDRFDPVSLAILVSCLLAAAAMVLKGPPWASQHGLPAWPVVLTCAVVFLVQQSHRLVTVPGQQAGWKCVVDTWNRIARIVIYERPQKPGDTWSPHATVKLAFLPEWVGTINDCAAFPVIQEYRDIAQLDYLRFDINALPFYFADDRAAAVIGAGGGKDILTASSFGMKTIDAIEMNAGIVKVINETIRRFTGAPYSSFGCRTVIMDARRFFETSRSKYSVILSSMTDTWASVMNGGMVLLESYLYTKEAIGSYVDHLDDTGVLGVLRFSLEPDCEMLRLTATAADVLAGGGITNAAAHIVVISKPVQRESGIGLLMVKKSPFTSRDVDRLRVLCQHMGFSIVLAPRMTSHPDFMAALRTETRRDLVRKIALNVFPVTDDRPFFFQSIPFWDLFSRNTGALRRLHLMEGSLLPIFKFFMLALLILAACLVAGLPDAGGATAARDLGLSLCAASTGVAFMLIEMPLVQQYVLFFSEPVGATAFVLSILLVSAGVGSCIVDKVSRSRLLRLTGCAIAVTGAVVALQVLYGDDLRTALVGSRWRLVLLGTMLVPLGAAMGVPFPALLRQGSLEEDDFPATAWAVNGSASVVGAVGATLLAVFLGFRAVMIAGVCVYAIALVCFWFALRGNKRLGRNGSSPP